MMNETIDEKERTHALAGAIDNDGNPHTLEHLERIKREAEAPDAK